MRLYWRSYRLEVTKKSGNYNNCQDMVVLTIEPFRYWFIFFILLFAIVIHFSVENVFGIQAKVKVLKNTVEPLYSGHAL